MMNQTTVYTANGYGPPPGAPPGGFGPPPGAPPGGFGPPPGAPPGGFGPPPGAPPGGYGAPPGGFGPPPGAPPGGFGPPPGAPPGGFGPPPGAPLGGYGTPPGVFDPYAPPQQMGMSPYGPYGGIPQEAPDAQTAMVLGIVSIFCFGFITGPIAIIKARSAQAAIQANPQLGGAGKAQAGLITGIIGTALNILSFLMVLARH